MRHLSSSGMCQEAALWLQSLRQSGLSPASLDFYARLIGYFDAHLTQVKRRPVEASEVTRNDVRRWWTRLTAEGLKPATLESRFGAVSRFFDWLERTGRIFSNPCTGLPIPRGPRPLRLVPSAADVRRFLLSVESDSPLDQRDRAILEVFYGAGLRRRELAELKVDSINFEDRVVRVTGKGRERLIPLTHAAVESVQIYCQEGRKRLLAGRASSALWIDARMRRGITTECIPHMLRKRSGSAGFHVSAQVFRRAFATHLLSRGMSIADLQLLLGHANFQHMHHYLRYAPRDLIETHRNSRLGI